VGKNFNTGFGALEYEIVVTLENNTDFNIAELEVIIFNKKTHGITLYPVTRFTEPMPRGAIRTELGEAAKSNSRWTKVTSIAAVAAAVIAFFAGY
jgi:hypothetical protein